MNKHNFPLRTSFLIWASAGLIPLLWPWSSQAQSPQSPNTPSGAVQSVDFIVAVVNSEPITNQEVQSLSMRLVRESRSLSRTLSPQEGQQLALEQLINDKAQIQQAINAGIVIDEVDLDQAEATVAGNNQISRENLRLRLQQDGISIASFRGQLRDQLMLTRVREREVEARVRITDLEIEQFLHEQLKSRASIAPVELNLAMILIAVPENTTDEQTKPLAEKAREISQRARSGENFADLAKAFSQAFDRGANGGAMGLRPADRYPDLFVRAAAALPVGGTSDVLRSGAGFHILKVLERKQAPATLMSTQTRARHILLRLGPQMTQSQALAKLNAVRRDIVSGQVDFATVAKRMSQDGSAAQGGDLGWATPGMFVPEFEQTMDRLQPGQLAEPLVSRFGVHLIEVTDRREVPMNQEEQRTLARNVLKDKKMNEAYIAWKEDVRSRAYVEMREPPQ